MSRRPRPGNRGSNRPDAGATSTTASRAERRDQLRKERQERELREQAAKRRKRRLYQLAAALGLAVVVVGVAIAISQSGSGSKHASGNAGAAAVTAQLAGIPQSGITLGKPDAPITISEYADLQCPLCQEFSLNTLPQLVAKDVRAGRVKLEFHNLETATRDPSVFETEAVAALAAGKQNRLWNYVELFYRNQGEEGSGYVTDAFLSSLARSTPGLDTTQWNQDRSDPSVPGQLTTDSTAASKLKFTGTPSFNITGPHSRSQALAGVASYAEVEKAVQSMLR